MTQKEVWKRVPEYERYEVSNTGLVRSLSTTVLYSNGFSRVHKGVVLKQNPDKAGYMMVCLCNRGSQKSFRVHKLIARAFLGRTPLGKEVSHIDGDKNNNQASNLEFCSHSENCQRKIQHGTSQVGERNGNSKITREVAISIFSEQGSLREISNRFGVSRTTVRDIKTKKTWRHIHE